MLCSVLSNAMTEWMRMSDRLYKFSWDFVGDVEAGRPNLGNTTRIEVYRLFQYTMRDILEQKLGTEAADRVFYDAGFLAGGSLCEKFIGKVEDLGEFLAKVEALFRELNIGVLRLEKSDVENGDFVLTVDEDLDCSGLPDIQHSVCTYDEGFIAGILHYQSGLHVAVQEIDCWCTGGRTCRFEAKLG